MRKRRIQLLERFVEEDKVQYKKTYEVPSKEEVSLGSSETCDICIHGGNVAGISRSHLTIYPDLKNPMIEDHSRNGTYINGYRIKDSLSPVRDGDVISIGPNYKLEVRIQEEKVKKRDFMGYINLRIRGMIRGGI